MLTGAWPRALDTTFQPGFAAGAALGAWSLREWYHWLLAPLAVLAMAACIIALFTHLE